MTQEITLTRGDNSGTIDELIEFLNKAKNKGATHYCMRWSNDPMWSFKWFETYRIKSEKELKEDEIKQCENRIKELTENGI